MRREIVAAPELDSLSDEWRPEDTASEARLINRIEDLPALESVSGNSIEWVVDGIIAQGALHMVTSEAGAAVRVNDFETVGIGV